MALLLAMVFTLVLGLITVALANLALSEIGAVQAVDRGVQAFAIADGAIERAKAILRLDPDWSDLAGATQNLDPSGTTFRPLYDPFQGKGRGGNAVNQPFPATNPVGTYTIEIRKASTDPTNNIWVRALGSYGGASRSIEVLLHRLTPVDFSAYSAGTYSPLQGGGGNVTIHGSAYFYSDLMLKAVQTGIYNDRAINPGDTPPYANQLYVRGTLDMSKGNPSIGTASQPMYGVHASHINNPSNNIYTLQLDNVVPVVQYPDVAGYIACLTGSPCPPNVTVVPPGNALVGSPPSALVLCLGVGKPQQTPNLVFGATYFYVPTASNASCLAGPSSTTSMLVWNPQAAIPLQLNSSLASAPILVPGTVTTQKPVTYTGVATIVVENVNGATYAFDTSNGGQILSSAPASGTGDILGCGYTAPSSMPSPDLLAFIVQTSARLQGNSNKCNQEQDVALVVGRYNPSLNPPTTDVLTSTKNIQIFGMAIASQLDTTQNPDFWQVPGLEQALPAPLLQLLSFTGPQPVVIREWHELTPQE